MRQSRAHISLHSRTKKVLDSIRAPGQSYDGVIQQLIAFYSDDDNRGLILRAGLTQDIREENRPKTKIKKMKVETNKESKRPQL